MLSDISRAIKQLLTANQVAEFYGFHPNRAGFIPCPFHGEKTASLKLYPGEGGWHCFGCGEGGDVVDFVAKLYSLSFKDACERINSDFGLGLSLAAPTKEQRSELLRARAEAEEKAKQEKELWLKYAEKHRRLLHDLKAYAPDNGHQNGFPEVLDPRFVKALQDLPYMEYWAEDQYSKK